MPLVRPPPQSTSAPPSQAPQEKQFPTLGVCSRTNYVAGLDDWLHITSPKHFPDFDLCPDCYNTSFRNTRYGPCFSTVPPKPANTSTSCDFSGLWVRIAYVWLFSNNAPDLTLMGNVAAIQHDEDGPCPNLNREDPEVKKGGNPAVTRRWYCLHDPKTNTLVEDLTFCSGCVANVNLIYPCLNGIFRLVANGQKLPATCDLMTLGNAQARGFQYFDCMVEVAEKTMATGTRDVSPLVEYIRKWAAIPFCKKGDIVTGERRYSLPSTVPDFTACEECYTRHIQPLLDTHPQPRVLSQLESSVPTNSGFTCDLYSPRLQQYFQEYSTTNNVQSYREKLTARNTKLQETKMQLQRMKQEHQQLKTQSNMHMNMMRVEQSSAMMSSMAWTTSRWSAPPVDWRGVNSQLTQGNELAMKAAMVLDNMALLEKEWKEFWE